MCALSRKDTFYLKAIKLILTLFPLELVEFFRGVVRAVLKAT